MSGTKGSTPRYPARSCKRASAHRVPVEVLTETLGLGLIDPNL